MLRLEILVSLIALFKLTDIQFSYRGGETLSFPDMEFHPGEEWLILGPSGCGKTTLLHLMSGLLRIQNGTISLDGTNYSGLNRAAMDAFRGKNIGIIFQQSHFLSALTVLDNLLMAQSVPGKRRNKTKAKEILDRLGLSHRHNHLPHQLSIGEQQRVSIARAVINEPSVILADEPTSALDDHNTQEVLGLLREQAQLFSSALIIVTHDTRLKTVVSNQIELNA